MFNSRIKNLKKELKKQQADGVLISSISNIAYLSGYSNFSNDEREAYIFMGKNFAYIITDARYSEAVRTQVPHLKLYQRGQEQKISDLFKKHQKEIKVLAVEEDNLTVLEYKEIKKYFKKIRHFNFLRSIKEKREIEKINKACQIGDLAFEFILKKLKTDVTEKKIAETLESFIRSKDAAISFPPIVAFGKNSSIPHHQTGDNKLNPSTRSARSGQEGQFILLDFGVKWENYCSDMTRTVFFGSFSEKQQKIYSTVLEAQQKAIEFLNKQIKQGKQIKASSVDKVARDFIMDKGFASIPHSLGHGIGLEVHEHPSLSPKSQDTLKEGMVFSIEPGIYIPHFGGVRIEDLFVLEAAKLRQLTTSPKTLTKV